MRLVYCATIKKNPEKYNADTKSTYNTNDEAEWLGQLKIFSGNMTYHLKTNDNKNVYNQNQNIVEVQLRF